MTTTLDQTTITDDLVDRATAAVLAEKFGYDNAHLVMIRSLPTRVWTNARREVRTALEAAVQENAAAVSSPAVISEFTGEYRFLSNFWPLAGAGGDKSFTAEHWYQMQKTLVPVEQCAIIECTTPGKVKRLSAELTVRPDWDEMKLDVMRTVVTRKFTLYPDLGRQLLATDSAVLIEGNTWCDTFWGCCSCDQHNGEGLNWLGILLMETRNTLKTQEPEGRMSAEYPAKERAAQQ